MHAVSTKNIVMIACCVTPRNDVRMLCYAKNRMHALSSKHTCHKSLSPLHVLQVDQIRLDANILLDCVDEALAAVSAHRQGHGDYKKASQQLAKVSLLAQRCQEWQEKVLVSDAWHLATWP